MQMWMASVRRAEPRLMPGKARFAKRAVVAIYRGSERGFAGLTPACLESGLRVGDMSVEASELALRRACLTGKQTEWPECWLLRAAASARSGICRP